MRITGFLCLLGVFSVVLIQPAFGDNLEDYIRDWVSHPARSKNELAEHFFLFQTSQPEEDARRLFGGLRRHFSGKDYQNIVHDLTYIIVDRIFDEVEEAGKEDLARALETLWRRYAFVENSPTNLSERTFVLILTFSRTRFDNPVELANFLVSDVVRFADPTDRQLFEDFINMSVIFYSSFAVEMQAWTKTVESLSDSFELRLIIEFPHLIFSKVKTSSLDRDLPWPRGAFAYAEKAYEKAFAAYWRAYSSRAKRASEFMLVSKTELPETPTYLKMKMSFLRKHAQKFVSETKSNPNPFMMSLEYLAGLYAGNQEVQDALDKKGREILTRSVDALDAMSLFYSEMESMEGLSDVQKKGIQSIAEVVLEAYLVHDLSFYHPKFLEILERLPAKLRGSVNGDYTRVYYKPGVCQRLIGFISSNL